MSLGPILFFALLGSVVSVGLAAGILLLRPVLLGRVTAVLIPFAMGSLLGAAFLGMIPKALQALPADRVLPSILAGIVLFYLLEKLTLWRHCHEPQCDTHTAEGPMILIGDAIHNFVDGVVIAAAFAGSPSLGVATGVAVVAHEIPQEVGDFAVLLQGGFSRWRALAFNTLSATATLPGALLGWAFLPSIAGVVPYLLALSAASFIYIALADLVPGRRPRLGGWVVAMELVLITLGAGVIAVIKEIMHHG
jgi:zinc and cadmium transporter